MMKVALRHHHLIRVDNAQKGHVYLCPFCRHQVILCCSRGRRYFAHFSNHGDCGGETSEHLKGKAQIANFLKTETRDVEIEKYLPRIQQWPDIFVDDSVAIEFQCSPISARKLASRIHGYHILGMRSWWILGRPYYRRKMGVKYLERFMRYSKHLGFYLSFWLTNVGCLEIHYQYREEDGKLSYRLKRFRAFRDLIAFMKNSWPASVNQEGTILSDVRQLQRMVFYHKKDYVYLQLRLNCLNYGLGSCPLVCHYPRVSPPVFKGEALLWRVWILCLLKRGLSLDYVYHQANRKLLLPLTFIQIHGIGRFYRHSFLQYVSLLIRSGNLVVDEGNVIKWKKPFWFKSVYDKKRFLIQNNSRY